MKKRVLAKEKNINTELLLEMVLEIDNIMMTLDKIRSDFNNDDINKLALSNLLFLSEKRVSDRLNELRMKGYFQLDKLVGKKKLFSRLERIEETTPEYYKVKYHLTKEEMKEEVLKHIALFGFIGKE